LPRYGLVHAPLARSALADRLRRETRADILFTEPDRGRYATDASIYQVMPESVIVPIGTDVVVLFADCFNHHFAPENLRAALRVLRAAGPGDLIVADGTSCRHQIRDLSGREAVHSVRVLEMALGR
jgi:Fe-S oxidoreductase